MNDYDQKLHLLPALTYIAMNCKDHSFTRLIFALAQLGFVVFFFSQQLYSYSSPSADDDEGTCSDDVVEEAECEAPSVFTTTVFDKLWWLWTPMEVVTQICFCYFVFKHWKNRELKFANGGLTPEYVEPAPRPNLSNSRDDESQLIDGPRRFNKDIEL